MKLFNPFYLKYFSDAVKSGGLSEAAQRNYVTQSAVSQAIRKLEKHFGVELITHHPNKLKLTPAGEVLYEASSRLFDCMQEMNNLLIEKPGELSGSIEFACSHSFALTQLPKRMGEFQKRFPSVQLSFRLAHSDTIMRWVQRGIIDFGVVLDNMDLSAFETDELYCGRHELYYSAKVKAPLELPFILSEEQKETLALQKLYQAKFKRGLLKGLEVSSWEVIASFADQGLGVGFLPDYAASNKKGLKILDLGLPPIPYKIYAIHSLNIPLNKPAREFIAFFKNLTNKASKKSTSQGGVK